MFGNYLKIALRNLKRQKLHSFINIFGLAIGLTATFLILAYVKHELSYDKFNRNADHIYRFLVTMKRPGNPGNTYPININRVGPEAKEQFPQVINYVRIKPQGDTYVDYKENRYSEISSLYADSTFFSLFEYELVRGNPQKVLADPRGVVISTALADKIFPGEDPLGKMLSVADEKYRITGIMKEFPANSHLQYEMILPLQSLPGFNQMGSLEYATYIEIASSADNSEIRAQIAELSDQLISERFKESGYEIDSRLQKLTDIHLRSGDLQHDYGSNGDEQRVFMYLFLAVVILVVAIINYLNLFTARAESRTREVGLRKVMGAFRKDLMKQFLGESILTTIIAWLLALALVELLVDDFGNLLGRDLSTNYFQEPIQFLGILGIALLVGVLAGYYPAFYLSKFNVIRIFRGGKKSDKGKSSLTVGLVIVQFVIAIFLISAVIIFNRQINYMKNKELGFNSDHVLVLKGLSETLKKSYGTIEEKLRDNPNIDYVTSSQAVPGVKRRSGQTVFKVGSSQSSGIAIKENRVNYDYIETMGIRLKEGRSFSKEYGDETHSFIINEKARRMLGLENPTGQRLSFGFLEGTVIGVVEDYNFTSLKHDVDPLILTNYSSTRNKFYYSLRIKPERIDETLGYVENTLQSIDPNYTLDYFFLDDRFDRLYRSEERSSKLVAFATLLAIIIAFLGLFALTSLSIIKRTREIGIRKAMGASRQAILGLFTTGMLRWILTASLISFPLIWYFMNQWLQNFSYRIDIRFWMLLLAALTATLVALLTTGTLTMRAANINPAQTLRDE
jgi:putative ABC transport system permease protein